MNTQCLTEHLSSQYTCPASLMTRESTGGPPLTLRLGRHHVCRYLSTDTDTSNTWTRQVMVLMVPWDLTPARFHPDVLTAPFLKLSGIVILDRILHPGPSLGGRLIPQDLVSLSSSLVHSVWGWPRANRETTNGNCVWQEERAGDGPSFMGSHRPEGPLPRGAGSTAESRNLVSDTCQMHVHAQHVSGFVWAVGIQLETRSCSFTESLP